MILNKRVEQLKQMGFEPFSNWAYDFVSPDNWDVIITIEFIENIDENSWQETIEEIKNGYKEGETIFIELTKKK